MYDGGHDATRFMIYDYMHYPSSLIFSYYPELSLAFHQLHISNRYEGLIGPH